MLEPFDETKDNFVVKFSFSVILTHHALSLIVFYLHLCQNCDMHIV